MESEKQTSQGQNVNMNDAFNEAFRLIGDVMKASVGSMVETLQESPNNNERVDLVNAYRQEEMNWYDASGIAENAFRTTTQNLWYLHYLNKKRLQRLGLNVKYNKMRPMNYRVYGSDSKYPDFSYEYDGKNRLVTIKDKMYYQKAYFEGDRLVWEDKGTGQEGKYYLIQSKTEEGRCICPNCGNEDDIQKFLDGCDYCQTKFRIEDFDQKISSVYMPGDNTYDRDASTYKKYFQAKYIPLIFLVMIFMPVLFLFLPLLLVGYVVYSISASSKAMKDSKEFGPIKTNETIEKIKVNDNSFSNEVFISNITNKLTSIFYADTKDEIQIFAQCDLSGLLQESSRVIDCKLLECSLLDYKADDIYEHLDVRAVVKLAIYDQNRVHHEKSLLYMTMLREKKAIEQSLNDVNVYHCKHCGASVSLLNGGVCEYCGNSVDLKAYDWVIESLKVVPEEEKRA